MLGKVLKIIGLLFLVLTGTALLLIGIFWAVFSWGQAQKRREKVVHQREVCDTMKLVDNQFSAFMVDFNKSELKSVDFYLIRNHQTIKNQSQKISFDPKSKVQKVPIPFQKFYTSDTVVVKVGRRYFLLSGLQYLAEQQYGMFGPVGSCDCVLDQFKNLNGMPINSRELYLSKQDALLDYRLPN